MFKFRFIYTCFLSLVLMTSYRQAEINEDRPAETLEVKDKLFDKFFSFLKGEYNTKNQLIFTINFFYNYRWQTKTISNNSCTI